MVTKTLILLSENYIDFFYGREFDYIIEVPAEPSREDIDKAISDARMEVRRLWSEEPSADKEVRITLGCNQAYRVVPFDLKAVMLADEGIIITIEGAEERKPSETEMAAMKEYNRIMASRR
jgi:hypothetical protein